MMRIYYTLEDDLYCEGRWYLNRLCDCSGIELDSRIFCYGELVDVGPPIQAKTWKEGIPVAAYPPLKVLLDPEMPGTPLDFTYTNANMPVATTPVATILASIAPQDIQRIPVLVESREQGYEIINVVRLIDCIDVERSEIQWYEKGNDIRPDLAGQPEMVIELVIDPSRVGDHHIFRISGWEVEIVVSDVIKEALEKVYATGVGFRQVSW